MALTHNSDISVYLVKFFKLKDLIHYSMVNKETYQTVRKYPIYAELLRLKFDKHHTDSIHTISSNITTNTA